MNIYSRFFLLKIYIYLSILRAAGVMSMRDFGCALSHFKALVSKEFVVDLDNAALLKYCLQWLFPGGTGSGAELRRQ